MNLFGFKSEKNATSGSDFLLLHINLQSSYKIRLEEGLLACYEMLIYSSLKSKLDYFTE